MEDTEIQRLVAKAQDGDTDAYGKLYDHFFAQVYRYVSFRLPSEAVEDLVAEIFVQAWEKITSYKPQKGVPFAAWLFRLARYRVIDTYRSHKGWEEMPEDMADPDTLNRADEPLRKKELLRSVRSALDKLPERYRDVLHLSYVADLPTSEVARVLRIREGTVRILKHRAIRKLASFLPTDMVSGDH